MSGVLHSVFASTAGSRPSTWGISGPTFLGIYAGLIVGVLLGVLVARRRLAGSTNPFVSDVSDLDPCDLAMLKEGEALAVTTAVAELRGRGAIEEDRDDPTRLSLRVAPAGLDPLELAVFQRLGEVPNSKARDLEVAPDSAIALASMRERLVADGLMLTDAQRARIRRLAIPIGALIGIGIVRIVAGIANHKPVGFLVFLVIAVGLLLWKWALEPPQATTRGRELLKVARREAGDLKEVGFADPRLGLAVALSGSSAMWKAEPGLAAILDLPKSSGGDGGGGGCGGGCGGCGG